MPRPWPRDPLDFLCKQLFLEDVFAGVWKRLQAPISLILPDLSGGLSVAVQPMVPRQKDGSSEGGNAIQGSENCAPRSEDPACILQAEPPAYPGHPLQAAVSAHDEVPSHQGQALKPGRPRDQEVALHHEEAAGAPG